MYLKGILPVVVHYSYEATCYLVSEHELSGVFYNTADGAIKEKVPETNLFSFPTEHTTLHSLYCYVVLNLKVTYI